MAKNNKAYKIVNAEKDRILEVLKASRLKGRAHTNYNLQYTKTSAKLTITFPVAENTRLIGILQREGYITRRVRKFVPTQEFGHVTKLYYTAEKLITTV